MSSDTVHRPLTHNVYARLAQTTHLRHHGVTPGTYVGPQQPLAPPPPPDVEGRRSTVPSRGSELRPALRRAAFPLLEFRRARRRAAASARRHRDAQGPGRGAEFYPAPAGPGRPTDASAPSTRRSPFSAGPTGAARSATGWMLLEDLLVIDAATIYLRYDGAGKLYCSTSSTARRSSR